MSGGGGGGDGGPPDLPPVVACEDLVFEATVWSPQPAIVSILKVGEILEVALEDEDGVRRVALRRDGDLVGTLVGSNLANLIRCLQQEIRYRAEVLAVEGGQVKVRVSPTT